MRMEEWKIIRSIINFPCKEGGSLANICHHLPDPINTDVPNLKLALSFELGADVANRYCLPLHRAFQDASSKGSVLVDARKIVTTYRAAILAPSAFHNDQRVYMKLLQDFTVQYDGPSSTVPNNSGTTCNGWILADILNVVAVAAVGDHDVQYTAGLLNESIQRLASGETTITVSLLLEALERCPGVMQNFRSQMISRLTSSQHLKLLAGEEVSCQN